MELSYENVLELKGNITSFEQLERLARANNLSYSTIELKSLYEFVKGSKVELSDADLDSCNGGQMDFEFRSGRCIHCNQKIMLLSGKITFCHHCGFPNRG